MPKIEAQKHQECQVQSSGLAIRYRSYGSGAAVVILSGGPGFDCDYMQPVAEALSDHHRAILVDLRGTGRSVPAVINHDTVNLKLTLCDLEAIRKQLGLERWPVLGHSAGAMLAMAYAANFPSHVSGLLLANSGPIRAASSGAEMDNVIMRLTPQERDEMSKSGAQDFGARFKFLAPGYFFDRRHVSELPPAFGPANFHAETANFLAADLFAGGDLRPGLKNFSRAVLIIAGRQDPCDPAMQYEIHLALKNSTLRLLDRCGHFPWIEQPQAFYKAVREFLAQHTA